VAAASLVLSLTVVTRDQSEATRTAEVMARAATGLALEGITISFHIGTVDDDDVDPSG
jgi:hypothetical protein